MEREGETEGERGKESPREMESLRQTGSEKDSRGIYRGQKGGVYEEINKERWRGCRGTQREI